MSRAWQLAKMTDRYTTLVEHLTLFIPSINTKSETLKSKRAEPYYRCSGKVHNAHLLIVDGAWCGCGC